MRAVSRSTAATGRRSSGRSSDVLAAVTQLDEAGYRGPYALALAPALYNGLFRLYPGTDVSQLEHLRRLCTRGIYKAPIEGGVFVDPRVGALDPRPGSARRLYRPGRRALPALSSPRASSCASTSRRRSAPSPRASISVKGADAPAARWSPAAARRRKS